MSEQPQAAPEAPTGDTAELTDEELPDWARRKLEKANKEAATYRSRLREAEPLAQRARELEESQKTESQRLVDALEAEKRRAADAEQALLRYRVASSKNLRPELVDRLRGTTEDELAEDADRLLALTAPPQQAPPSFDGGPRGTSAAPSDWNSAFRRVAGKPS